MTIKAVEVGLPFGPRRRTVVLRCAQGFRVYTEVDQAGVHQTGVHLVVPLDRVDHAVALAERYYYVDRPATMELLVQRLTPKALFVYKIGTNLAFSGGPVTNGADVRFLVDGLGAPPRAGIIWSENGVPLFADDGGRIGRETFSSWDDIRRCFDHCALRFGPFLAIYSEVEAALCRRCDFDTPTGQLAILTSLGFPRGPVSPLACGRAFALLATSPFKGGVLAANPDLAAAFRRKAAELLEAHPALPQLRLPLALFLGAADRWAARTVAHCLLRPYGVPRELVLLVVRWMGKLAAGSCA